MENEEIRMTENEGILLITSMINKAKNRYSENGVLYLLWGWLIFICCIIQFVSLHFLIIRKYIMYGFLPGRCLYTRYIT